MPLEEADLIVIGTGIASVPARKCAAAGWKVVLVDERPPGGTCALRGCTPKKMLRAGAAVLDAARRFQGHGVAPEAPAGDWRALQRFKDGYVLPIPGNNSALYQEQGIEFVEGQARFLSPETVAVRLADGGERRLRARHIVLATGARPARLAFPGAEFALSSDDFLVLPELPRRMAFIGGGFISMEFAHIAARFGVECTIIHSHERPLNAFDPDLVDLLVRASREEAGIAFRLNARVAAIEHRGGAFRLRATTQGEPDVIVEADLVVHGAGRTPCIESLDTEAGGVATGRRGIEVNEYLQSTTNPRVYACGDCAATPGPQLSFTATAEGLAVASNLLEGNVHTVDYSGQAAVAFTLPAIASAGLSEQQARERHGDDLDVRFADSTRWFTNRHLNEPAGAYKFLIQKSTDRLLGAHLLAHHCEESINVFALAIRQGLTRHDLKSTLWAHPSSGSDMSRMLG